MKPQQERITKGFMFVIVVGLTSVLICCNENRENRNENNLSDTIISDTPVTQNKKLEGNDKILDDQVVKKLTPFFSKKKDEFSDNQTVWYTPKDAPKFVNYNGIYCYFQVNNGVASNLRLNIQYAADDWLFFKSIQFSVDGMAYEYTPDKVETDNGDGSIWEWSDQQISPGDQSLIIAFTMAKTAKMKFIGSKYYKIKTITPKQIASIKRTYNLYKAMGGEI